LKPRGIIIRIRNKKKATRRKIKGSSKKDEKEENRNPKNKGQQKEKREAKGENTENLKKEKPQKHLKEEAEKHIEEQFVLPGDIVGTNEEYEAGEGTYTLRGNIYSTRTGHVEIDRKKRSVSVRATSELPPVIKKDDIVVGNVVNVRDSMALVQIAAIKGHGEREVNNPGIAAIHISNIKEDYVKNISNELALMDVVKAKVIDTDSMRLSIAAKELGVMSAICGRCGEPLAIEEGKLKCPACGRIEKRKLSADYGTGII
jgi:exosome complex component CSL4